MTDTEFNAEKFHADLVQDKRMADRWQAITDMVKHHADSMGVQITARDVETMPSARIALWTGTPLEGEPYERELLGLRPVQIAKERAELATKLASSDDDAHARLMAMPRSERMTYVREQGLDQKASEAPVDTKDDKMKILLAMTDRAARIALGRKWGIIQ